ncbi:hypothetical protein [Planktothrix pseudagardhii]|uniref:Uncharacterized protein n=1 Tax=Planktothrix pseudagardhii TaxID=132604 RepID=A0A9W4CI92_9CYAN|nr:hypothetical protein [Planktothrix pseudagardhii]CAD5919750.1 hypothetical protein NO713_00583 [Planktothrix pseudagardhii]
MDPITWAIIIGSFLGGAAIGYFWDEIKAWASKVLGYILDGINYLIEVTSDAVVYLVKQGTRVYKRIEVYVRNIRTGGTRLEYRQEEISPYDLPDDINAELNRKMNNKLEIARGST